MPIELPFGNATLIIEPVENYNEYPPANHQSINPISAYRLSIKTAPGNQERVMTILATATEFHQNVNEKYMAFINIDFDDPHIVRPETLLNPENRPSVCQLPNGRLYCRKCHCYVPNTANAEMRKEGCFTHSHACGIKQPDETYLTPDEYPNI